MDGSISNSAGLKSISFIERLSGIMLNVRTNPRILFAIRLPCSVCLALYATYYLELQNSFWAATTAAIVCQPNLGASVQKGRYRVAGTILGAIVIIGLLAAFAQQRDALIFFLAVWCGICGFATVTLRNYGSYAAALSGITATIIFADSLSNPADAFLLAVTRVGEICIGIASACVVMIAIKGDTAAKQLSMMFEQFAKDLWTGFSASVDRSNPAIDQTRQRHILIRRFGTLRAQIDAVVGESSYHHSRIGNLNRTVVQLLRTLVSWRDIEHLIANQTSRTTNDVLAHCLDRLDPKDMIEDPASFLRRCKEVAQELSNTPVEHSGDAVIFAGVLELIECLEAIAECLCILLHSGPRPRPRSFSLPLIVDPAPAILAAMRVMSAVLLTATFWIQTAWSAGSFAVVFAAIGTLVFAAQGDQAPLRAKEYSIGAAAMLALGSALYFGVLPSLTSFPQLVALLVLFYASIGFMQSGKSHSTSYLAMSVCSLPMLGLSNPTIFDATNFFNLASTIVIGTLIGVGFFGLIPPLTPLRTERRIYERSLRDFRKFLSSVSHSKSEICTSMLSARLCALPATASDQTFSAIMSMSSAVTAATELSSDLANMPELGTLQQALLDYADSNVARGNLGLKRLGPLISGHDDEVSSDHQLRSMAHLYVLEESIAQSLLIQNAFAEAPHEMKGQFNV